MAGRSVVVEAEALLCEPAEVDRLHGAQRDDAVQRAGSLLLALLVHAHVNVRAKRLPHRRPRHLLDAAHAQEDGAKRAALHHHALLDDDGAERRATLANLGLVWPRRHELTVEGRLALPVEHLKILRPDALGQGWRRGVGGGVGVAAGILLAKSTGSRQLFLIGGLPELFDDLLIQVLHPIKTVGLGLVLDLGRLVGRLSNRRGRQRRHGDDGSDHGQMTLLRRQAQGVVDI
mmetsp:Transcript_26347/g.66886  ORF Transcript_26347/g.66886 Transcript_26347/m.66886 type:complete len:232 (-) Transcript_26347:125-820(-)